MKLNRNNFKLSHTVWHKRTFDAASAEDLRVYQDFLLNSRWRDGCPFIVEWPFLTVVDLIKHKIVKQHIAGLIKQAKS
jgi:hypothetical protein